MFERLKTSGSERRGSCSGKRRESAAWLRQLAGPERARYDPAAAAADAEKSEWLDNNRGSCLCCSPPSLFVFKVCRQASPHLSTDPSICPSSLSSLRTAGALELFDCKPYVLDIY
jgi:hypothetical protein